MSDRSFSQAAHSCDSQSALSGWNIVLKSLLVYVWYTQLYCMYMYKIVVYLAQLRSIYYIHIVCIVNKVWIVLIVCIATVVFIT